MYSSVGNLGAGTYGICRGAAAAPDPAKGSRSFGSGYVDIQRPFWALACVGNPQEAGWAASGGLPPGTLGPSRRARRGRAIRISAAQGQRID